MPPLDDRQQYSLNAVLYDAVNSSNLDRVKLCLSRGAQATPAEMKEYFRGRNEDPVPLAHLAASRNNKQVLEALGQAGLVVDEKDDQGNTALAKAVKGVRLETVRNLIALGASPLEKNKMNKTVLDLARDNAGLMNNDAVIDALLNAVPLPGAFNDAAKKAEPAVATSENITVSKPISLTAPHKKSGFEL